MISERFAHGLGDLVLVSARSAASLGGLYFRSAATSLSIAVSCACSPASRMVACDS
jgi:hypothetical protein